MKKVDDAYKKMKDLSQGMPISYIAETGDYIFTDAMTEDSNCKRFPIVNKNSGEIELLSDYLELACIGADSVFIYYEKLFSDYMIACKERKSDKDLADLYATEWNRLYFTKESDIKEYTNREEYEKIISSWEHIEQILYSDIIEALDSDDSFMYPPSVLDKMDDSFFRIKPFMVRYGYTDDSSRKIWTII